LASPRVNVMLVMAWEPGGAAGEQRIRFTSVLDKQGQLDLPAWNADPEPWPAEHNRLDAPVRHGDVVHDEDGWALRLSAGEGIDPEAALHRFLNHERGFRPGEVVTLSAQNGVTTAWRVVGID